MECVEATRLTIFFDSVTKWSIVPAILEPFEYMFQDLGWMTSIPCDVDPGLIIVWMIRAPPPIPLKSVFVISLPCYQSPNLEVIQELGWRYHIVESDTPVRYPKLALMESSREGKRILLNFEVFYMARVLQVLRHLWCLTRWRKNIFHVPRVGKSARGLSPCRPLRNEVMQRYTHPRRGSRVRRYLYLPHFWG